MPLQGPYAAGVLIPQWALITIAAVMIGLRFNLRLRIQRASITASDILMLCAWLSSVITASFDIIFTLKGVLKPDINYILVGYDGTPDEIEYIQKQSRIIGKYLQLFPIFMKKRRIFLWAVVCYCAAAYIATQFLTIFICSPVEGNWSLDPDIECTTLQVVQNFVVGWSLHFSGDVMVFCLPFLVLHKLRMGRRMKIGVYCTFFLGIINISFCLTRFMTIRLSGRNSRPSLSLVELWSALDNNIGLVIACLPSLRPYLRGSLANSYKYSAKSSGIKTIGSLKTGGALTPSRANFQRVDEEMPHASYPSDGRASTTTRITGVRDVGDLWGDGKQSNGDRDIELMVRTSTHRQVLS